LTNTPIQSIVPTGLTTVDGIKHDFDIIIYATGCDVARDGVGLNAGVHGEGGLELKEYWRSIDGPQSYSGLAVPGFPNYFMVLGPNAISGSWGFTIGVQTEVIARIVKEVSTVELAAAER
jgi:cation diffusion facilitator CzcD-associated flavoprotein CzcO